MALQCLAGEQYQRSENGKREFICGKSGELSEIIIFSLVWKVLLCLPHLKYSFFPQYLFIQFCSVLFLNVLFISLNWRCGPRLERDWVTWRIPRHAIHLWRSSSLVFLSIQQQFIYFHNFFLHFYGVPSQMLDCQFLSHFYFLLRHSRGTLFCFDNHTSRRGEDFFVVQLTYDENHKFVVSFFFSLLILVKEVSADIPPRGDSGML